MSSRLDLNTKLKETLGSDNVYFDPPPSFVLSYPCIVYTINKFRSFHADNLPFLIRPGYLLTLIDASGEDELLKKLLSLPKTAHVNSFVANNMHHHNISIYI